METNPMQMFDELINGDYTAPILGEAVNACILDNDGEVQAAKEYFNSFKTVEVTLSRNDQEAYFHSTNKRKVGIVFANPPSPSKGSFDVKMKLFGTFDVQFDYTGKAEELHTDTSIDKFSELAKFPRGVRDLLLDLQDKSKITVTAEIELVSLDKSRSVNRAMSAIELRNMILDGIKGCVYDGYGSPHKNDTVYVARETSRKKYTAGGSAEVVSIWFGLSGVSKTMEINELRRILDSASANDLGIKSVEDLYILMCLIPRTFDDVRICTEDRVETAISQLKVYRYERLKAAQDAGVIGDGVEITREYVDGRLTKEEYLNLIKFFGGTPPAKVRFRKPRKKEETPEDSF